MQGAVFEREYTGTGRVPSLVEPTRSVEHTSSPVREKNDATGTHSADNVGVRTPFP